MDTSSTIIDNEMEETSRGTKELVRLKLNRRTQAEEESSYGYMAPTEPQPQFFQPPTLQFSSTCINNRAVSTHSQFEKHQQF